MGLGAEDSRTGLTLLALIGLMDAKAMAQERITQYEMLAAMRHVGAFELEFVRYAILETNGRIKVNPK